MWRPGSGRAQWVDVLFWPCILTPGVGMMGVEPMQFMMGSRRLRLGVAALALATLFAGAPARAETSGNSNSDAGIGALSAVASLFYGPAKLLYAAGGLIFGGIAWGLSGGDNQVAHAVITPAIHGDYVITPEIIRGQRRPEFYGRDPRYRDTDYAQRPVQDSSTSAPLVEEEY